MGQLDRLFTDADQIEAALLEYDAAALRKLCALLIRQYVLQEGVEYEGLPREDSVQPGREIKENPEMPAPPSVSVKPKPEIKQERTKPAGTKGASAEIQKRFKNIEMD
jgi:hypothetical protein